MKKPSLLDRLTGSALADDAYDDLFDDSHHTPPEAQANNQKPEKRNVPIQSETPPAPQHDNWEADIEDDGENPCWGQSTGRPRNLRPHE